MTGMRSTFQCWLTLACSKGLLGLVHGATSAPVVVIGWNWVRQFARFNEVWVITRVNNLQSIEDSLAKEPLHKCLLHLFRSFEMVAMLEKGARGVHLYYYCLWQLEARVDRTRKARLRRFRSPRSSAARPSRFSSWLSTSVSDQCR